jgi:hypothetical protein
MNRRLWANLLALASPMVPCEVAGSSVPLGDLVNNFCFRETPNPIAVLHRVPRSLGTPQGHDHQPLQGQAADEFSHHCFEPLAAALNCLLFRVCDAAIDRAIGRSCDRLERFIFHDPA